MQFRRKALKLDMTPVIQSPDAHQFVRNGAAGDHQDLCCHWIARRTSGRGGNQFLGRFNGRRRIPAVGISADRLTELLV